MCCRLMRISQISSKDHQEFPPFRVVIDVVSRLMEWIRTIHSPLHSIEDILQASIPGGARSAESVLAQLC